MTHIFHLDQTLPLNLLNTSILEKQVINYQDIWWLFLHAKYLYHILNVDTNYLISLSHSKKKSPDSILSALKSLKTLKSITSFIHHVLSFVSENATDEHPQQSQSSSVRLYLKMIFKN